MPTKRNALGVHHLFISFATDGKVVLQVISNEGIHTYVYDSFKESLDELAKVEWTSHKDRVQAE